MGKVIRFPPVAPGDDIEISATTYAVYRRCPEQAAARLRGEFGPDSPRSFVGGLGHRVFARHLTSGPIPDGDFEQVCREEIGAGMNVKMASLGVRPSQLAGYIREVGALYTRFKAMAFAEFRSAEVELAASPAPGVRLKGAVDAVFDEDGGARLVDWKTGGIADDAHHQLAFYALLWALARNELPARVEAVSVATGQRTEGPVAAGELSETAGMVAAMIDALRAGWAAGTDQPRHAGPWCRYCPVLEACPEGEAAVTVLNRS